MGSSSSITKSNDGPDQAGSSSSITKSNDGPDQAGSSSSNTKSNDGPDQAGSSSSNTKSNDGPNQAGSSSSNTKSNDGPDQACIQNDSKNETPVHTSKEKRYHLQRVNGNMIYQGLTSVASVDETAIVPASNPPPDQLKVDNKSQNEMINKDNAQSQDVNTRTAEKDKEREKRRRCKEERDKVEYVKSRLSGTIAQFKKKYQEDEISLEWIDQATRMVITKRRKQESTFQATLDEDKHEQAWTKIVKLKKDKSRCMLRLSEAASSRLRYNNPNITDLSDENRATKLAEKFSELYDNQWTDAFDVTREHTGTTVTDRELTELLRTILELGYDKCRKVYDEHRNCLLRELSMNGTKDLPTISPAMSLRLMEFQRLVSQQSIQHCQKVVRGHVKDELNKIELPVRKQFGRDMKISPYTSYIDLCTDITWYMQIHDPPLVLDFEGSTVVRGRFRPYTVSGPVLDYIIWPAMLLHEGGPVVTKGVAQFKKEVDTVDSEWS